MKTQDRDVKKRRRAALSKMAILLAFTVLVWLFLTIAWFTMNKENAASGMGVKVGTMPFELKTSGAVAPNSNIIGELGYSDGSPVTGGYSTLGAGDIKWMLESSDTMAGTGISPGTQGSLYFTVVPKSYDDSQTLTITYSINLTVYRLNATKKAQIAEISSKIANNELDENGQPYTMPTVTLDDLIPLSDNLSDQNYSKAIDYIRGHILFFKNANNTGRIQIGETQTLTINCGTDKEIPLHWVWPETLGNMVMTSDNVTNVCIGDEKTALITYIQNNPSLYFIMNNLDSDMLDEDQKLNATVLGDDLSDTYPVLSLAYNNADQVIGTDAQYIMIELEVDGSID